MLRQAFRAVLWMLLPVSCARAASPQAALAAALLGTQASGVAVDLHTGAVIAVTGASGEATPGSALKPLLLQYALDHSIIRAQTQVFCRRALHIGALSLPCTHPAGQDVFTAESAVAESCNSYFADLGKRFSGDSLEAALRQSGLPHRAVNAASPEERELTTLGLRNVRAAPRDLARAYRAMALSAPADSPVLAGLRGSVDYGMAHAAATAGLVILGKTGTAADGGERWTHGWFAGILPGRFVLVIYVPHGDGGTAAALAHSFFVGAAADAENKGRR